MHPTLMIDLARDLGAERLRAADRARTAQQARAGRAAGRNARPWRAIRGAPARALAPMDHMDHMAAAVLAVPAR